MNNENQVGKVTPPEPVFAKKLNNRTLAQLQCTLAHLDEHGQGLSKRGRQIEKLIQARTK